MPLDWHFVVYPGGADVDEGAGVDEGDLFYTGVFYTGTHGVEEGAGVKDERRKNFRLLHWRLQHRLFKIILIL